MLKLSERNGELVATAAIFSAEDWESYFRVLMQKHVGSCTSAGGGGCKLCEEARRKGVDGKWHTSTIPSDSIWCGLFKGADGDDLPILVTQKGVLVWEPGAAYLAANPHARTAELPGKWASFAGSPERLTEFLFHVVKRMGRTIEELSADPNKPEPQSEAQGS